METALCPPNDRHRDLMPRNVGLDHRIHIVTMGQGQGVMPLRRLPHDGDADRGPLRRRLHHDGPAQFRRPHHGGA